MAHALAQTDHDSILSVMLEKGELAEVAKRANMTLAALATWANKHADLLTNLHQLLLTRAKLLAAHLELSALNALASVSSATTSTDDPKLRERALERQRKAANALLRHRTWLQRASGLAPSPRTAGRSVIDAVDDDEGRSDSSKSLIRSAPTPARSITVPPLSTSFTSHASSLPTALPSLDASMPLALMPSSSRTKKPSIAERLAARRLAALGSTAPK